MSEKKEKNREVGKEDGEKKEDKSKEQMYESRKNAQLVHDWYQSYYLWTSTMMASSILNSNLINHGTRVLNLPVNSAFNNSTNLGPNSRTQTQTYTSRTSPPVVSNPEPTRPVIPIFKIPSLLRRLAAEFIDAIYIQFVKVMFALILLNYTDLM